MFVSQILLSCTSRSGILVMAFRSATGNLNHLGIDKAPSKPTISYQNKNRDNETLFPEKFKGRPWIIFGLLVVLTVVSFINEHEKNKAEETANKNAKIDADRRDHLIDSTANARVDSSNKMILNGIGQAIGKYSLGYDSAKQELVVLQKLIKDSANRKTTIIQGESLYLNLIIIKVYHTVLYKMIHSL